MPLTKQRYNLSTRHQLIDLNKEFVNFKLDFQVISVDQKDFEVLVVDQTQLDSNPDIKTFQMKKTQGGKIGGNIVADKNKSQNYFLILRGLQDNEPTEVEVQINLEEITESFQALPVQTESQSTPSSTPTAQPTVSTNEKPFYRKVWFFILIIGIFVGIALYYYLFYIRGARDTTLPEGAATAPVPTISQNIKPALPADSGLYSKLRAIS
jgi:hypothetical protein